MIFEADELEELQADIGEILDDINPDRFNSFRGSDRVRDEDAPDQYVVTPSAVLVDQSCRFEITNSRDRFLAGLETSVNAFTLNRVQAGIDLRENDLITVLVKGDESAKTLKVLTILKKSNALQWRIICVAN